MTTMAQAIRAYVESAGSHTPEASHSTLVLLVNVVCRLLAERSCSCNGECDGRPYGDSCEHDVRGCSLQIWSVGAAVSTSGRWDVVEEVDLMQEKCGALAGARL